VVVIKFKQHPGAVGSDPAKHGAVKKKFRMAERDLQHICRQENCWNHHNRSEKFQFKQPACIFHKPENDMQVLEPAQSDKKIHFSGKNTLLNFILQKLAAVCGDVFF